MFWLLSNNIFRASPDPAAPLLSVALRARSDALRIRALAFAGACLLAGMAQAGALPRDEQERAEMRDFLKDTITKSDSFTDRFDAEALASVVSPTELHVLGSLFVVAGCHGLGSELDDGGCNPPNQLSDPPPSRSISGIGAPHESVEERGEVAAIGTHAELLNTSALYQRLTQTQLAA